MKTYHSNCSEMRYPTSEIQDATFNRRRGEKTLSFESVANTQKYSPGGLFFKKKKWGNDFVLQKCCFSPVNAIMDRGKN